MLILYFLLAQLVIESSFFSYILKITNFLIQMEERSGQQVHSSERIPSSLSAFGKQGTVRLLITNHPTFTF